MDLSDQALKKLQPLNEKGLNDWEEAYAAVEAYLLAMRVRNRILLADLVRNILALTAAQHQLHPESKPRRLAMEIALEKIARWTHEVLEEGGEIGLLSVRGRLALLLTDMPTRWQSVFLTPGPWPEEFLAAMRNSYLAAGPDFNPLPMQARPLELNTLGSGAARWSRYLDQRPLLRCLMLTIFICIVASLGWIIFLE